MGFMSFFVEEKPKVELAEVPVQTQELPSYDDSSSLRDKIESVKTEKFNKFLEQLKVLESVTSINVLARYQAALATSQITLEEVQSNIDAMTKKLNNELSAFEYKVNTATGDKDIEADLQIKAIQDEMQKNEEKVKELNLLNNDLNKQRDEISKNRQIVKVEGLTQISNFNSSVNDLKLEIENLSSQIKINLGVKV